MNLIKSLGIILIFLGSLKAQEVKILTYNIYHGEEYYNNGHSNIPEIANLIKTYKPDFVAMQEVDSMTVRTSHFNNGEKKNLIEELKHLTGMKGYFGKAMDYDEGGYGIGVLTVYPEKPKTYHLPNPTGGEPRVVMVLEHQFSNGKKIMLASTHLSHENEENRMAQIKKIDEILSNSKTASVITGDFNFNPGDAPYEYFSKKREDAALVFGNPKPTWPTDAPHERLDLIFLDKNLWKIKNIEVLKTSKASDHLPVLVTLKLNS